MLRDKLESELRSQIIDLEYRAAEENVLAQSQTIESQNIPCDIAERQRTIELKEQELEVYRSKIHQQELALQAERRAWQCELAEKQLLLQSRNAELEQNRSEIAALRKRVSELELVCQRSLPGSASNAQPRLGRKVAAFDRTWKANYEEQNSLADSLEESVVARRSPLEKGSQENWNPRDDDFVMGEPRLFDVQEIGFTRPEEGGDAMNRESEEKSAKIFASKRWPIRRQRRWKSRSDEQSDSK